MKTADEYYVDSSFKENWKYYVLRFQELLESLLLHLLHSYFLN